jgi:hypothetical protein
MTRADVAIILQYLGYHVDVDFVVFADFSGFNVNWLSQQPQPTEAEIDAAALPAYKAHYRALVRSTALTRIRAKYGDDDVISLVAGAYTSASAAEARAWIGAMRAKVATTIGQINAATTIEQLDAGWAALTWPEPPVGELVHDEADFAARLAQAAALRAAVAQADTDLTALMATSGALTTAQLSTYLRRTGEILRGVVRHVSRMT